MPRLPSDAAEIIGKRIRGHRLDRLRISQIELQNLSGIDTANIRKYEQGKAMPNLGSLVRIAFALGIDPGELVRGIKPSDLPDQPEVYRASDFVAERRRRTLGE